MKKVQFQHARISLLFVQIDKNLAFWNIRTIIHFYCEAIYHGILTALYVWLCRVRMHIPFLLRITDTVFFGELFCTTETLRLSLCTVNYYRWSLHYLHVMQFALHSKKPRVGDDSWLQSRTVYHGQFAIEKEYTSKENQNLESEEKSEKTTERNVTNGISLFLLTYKIKDFRLWRHTRAKACTNPSITFKMKCRHIIVLNRWCYFTIFVTKGNWLNSKENKLKSTKWTIFIFFRCFWETFSYISFVHSIICFTWSVVWRNRTSIPLTFNKKAKSVAYF